jgi:hypothetical protein
MKRISDGIIECPDTGICKIDIDKICQAFRESSLISEYDGEFRLYDYTPVRMLQRTKITISQRDAETIIAQLSLLKCQDGVFRKAYKYVLTHKLVRNTYKKNKV